MRKFDIPGRLRRLRAQNGFTNAQVAKQLGVAIAVYQNYEAGRSKPSIQTLLKLQELYCLASIDELLGFSQPAKPDTVVEKYQSLSIEKKKIVDYILENR